MFQLTVFSYHAAQNSASSAPTAQLQSHTSIFRYLSQQHHDFRYQHVYLFSAVSVTSGHKCSDFKQHTCIGLQFQSVRQSSWAKVKASVLPGCSMTQSHLTFKSLEATCVLCSLPLLVKLAVTPLISHVTHASGSPASLVHLKRIFFVTAYGPHQ